MGSTVVTGLNPGSLSEEARALREKIEAANAEAAQYWHDPLWRREMAAEMTELVLEGFEYESIIDYLFVTERVAAGDDITIRDVRGLRAYWVSVGGHIEESRLRRDVWRLPRDYIGFHVKELEENLERNFSENQQDLVSLAIRQMDAEINLYALRLWQAGIGVGDAGYIASNGVNLTLVDTAITEVQENSLDDEPVIVGRARMINQLVSILQENNHFTPETNEQLLTRGILGRYHNARIIKLQNYKDDSGRPFFPANEMYIAGRDAGKFGFWGGLRADEWSEQGGWYWHYHGRRMANGAVTRPDRVRRYVDTSIPATL